MVFRVWWSQPFTSATEVQQIDTFVTNGGASYPVSNKLISQVGSTVQYSNQQKNQYTGGFTKSATGITFSSAPVAGLQGVIPGQGCIPIVAYDNNNVTGVANANVGTKRFWIGDIDEIQSFYYTAQAGASGIYLSFVNNITSVTPDLTWVQLACTLANGTTATYASTGVTLGTPMISGFSTLGASSAANATSLLVYSATTPNATFYAGDLVYINPTQSNQEIIKVLSVSACTLTLSASLSYNHLIGEPVYSCAREFEAKETVPINATNNTASNYYNISLQVAYNRLARP